MNEFDRRWKQMVASSRRGAGAPESAAIAPARAARLAERALAQRDLGRQRTSEARGMALAASAFAASLFGLGVSSQALGYGPADLAQEWTRVQRQLPSTAFIPAPPRPADWRALAPAWQAFAPELEAVSPARFFLALDGWLVSGKTEVESSP